MHSLLKQYHPYIVDRHAKTLLPQVSLFLSDKIQSLRQGCQVSSEPLFFWPKIVNVLIFFPASTWPCSVSQWTTLRPTWLWSETYSAPTSRFNNDPKKTQPCVGLKRCVYRFSGHKLASELQVHKKYDLKGSTVDREASEKERGKSLPTLKVRNNAEDITWNKNAFLAT